MAVPLSFQRQQQNKAAGTVTNLERTFLSCFLAVTLQYFAIDSQAKDLRCYFVVIGHRVSPELQFEVSRWLEVSQAAAQVGVAVGRCPVLRGNRIYRLLLLVMIHFFSKSRRWRRKENVTRLCRIKYPVSS